MNNLIQNDPNINESLKKDKNILYIDKYDKNKKIIEKDDYICVIGGDGTLLKAINLFKDKNKPFFGIAAGTVNFLMNSEDYPTKNHIIKTFNLIKVKITYMNYERDLSSIDHHYVERTKIFQAFNDIMIGGDMNSWINFKVKEKNNIFGDFMGGGLIISTPQGSTGINKNNSGVVLPLSSKMWSITGDKTNRKIEYVIKPTKIKIQVNSRTPVKVWVDGSNYIINNVKNIEIVNGEKVKLIFNDYVEFKKKRRF